MYTIELDDLVSNAFIELYRMDTNTRFLPYSILEAYGGWVCDLLMKRDQKCRLLLSRDRTELFLQEHGDDFCEITVNGNKGVWLNDGVKASYLIRRYRGSLALDVLKAFTERSVVEKLKREVEMLL